MCYGMFHRKIIETECENNKAKKARPSLSRCNPRLWAESRSWGVLYPLDKLCNILSILTGPNACTVGTQLNSGPPNYKITITTQALKRSSGFYGTALPVIIASPPLLRASMS